MTHIHCTVVTPEETAVDVSANFVVVPFTDGEKGIGINHAPLIGQLGSGELRLRTGSETVRYFVDGGFVQVAENSVAILTNRAIPLKSLDQTVIREQLQAALDRTAHGADQIAEREGIVQKLRAQMRVAARR